jgi:hypothetical protein
MPVERRDASPAMPVRVSCLLPSACALTERRRNLASVVTPYGGDPRWDALLEGTRKAFELTMKGEETVDVQSDIPSMVSYLLSHALRSI